MFSHGYEVLPEIPGHNHQPEYPLTYHKTMDGLEVNSRA
jgi:hypothetical protein